MTKQYNITIEGLEIFDKLQKNSEKAFRSKFTEVVNDVVAVSASRTPVDSGRLEKGHSSDIYFKDNKAEGTVGFYAKNPDTGDNYAPRMHNDRYNLGEKSKNKKPIKSKFNGKPFTVGPKYLESTVDDLLPSYKKAIVESIVSSMKKK